MLHRYSEVLNLPVVCANNGKKVGVAADILFSAKDREVSAVLLEHKGILPGKKIIKFKDILNLGSDAIIIADQSCISIPGITMNFPQKKGEGVVLGVHILTKTGNELGVVKDVIFDCQTLRIEGFEISDGMFQDIVNGRKIMPLLGKVEFAEDSILVEKEAEEEMENTGGGIKGRIFGEKYTKKE